MKEIVELYSKLIIATFGFIGPSFTLLISIFSVQLLRAKQRHEKILVTLKDVVNSNTFVTDNTTGEIPAFLKAYEQKIRDNQKDIQLLNPRRQIRRIFISLGAAIVFIGFYHIAGMRFWDFHQPFSRITFLI